jgi:hypothetical protein
MEVHFSLKYGIVEYKFWFGICHYLEYRISVKLFKAGSGPEPILIDRSPPVAGSVLDGHIVHHDLTYQASDNEICAQWTGFYDPESGIDQLVISIILISNLLFTKGIQT